ncbi:calcium-activated chloride channel regulator 1-like [Chrysoperla carnea]|uniref:calcium-activated chloride channel regulator 1-like n=1 Tax=Chrysoperla carnea TaxID=189513 RepID=UPI001D094098|nr:calcium-activated chloride channel regulator 1-like [Chrysoperla carnea]
MPNNCKTILSNLEATLTTASHYLFTALDGRAFFQSINVILPTSWPDTCIPGGSRVSPATNSYSDITIQRRVTPGGTIPAWTQQTGGCGEPGNQIFLNYDTLENYSNSLGRTIVKEWAKYRYGVFDEIGYHNDPVYPMCYINDQDKSQKITGCSDFPINDNGLCADPSLTYNVSALIDERARTSIMFAAEAPTISMFCDDGNHNKMAPTKHNFLCNGRSTLDVILKHDDFLNKNLAFNETEDPTKKVIDTRPLFVYKKHQLTRYVLIIEDTKDMLLRESWSFLRHAIRKWAVFDLAENTEVGLVLANETAASVLLKISSLKDHRARDLVASNIPYTPSDSRSGCLRCAIEEAITMLTDRSRVHGAASSVILVIAPGMDYTTDSVLTSKAKASEIRISTINYPNILRQQPLDILAEETGGVAFSVYEEKHNNINSHFSTYFKLTNVLYNIAEIYFESGESRMPIEIHRREITDDGRNSVTGGFVLSSELGEPARFSVFTHNSEMPLIRSITLVSPSQVTYSTRSDSLLSVKLLTVPANINETGTWTYTIERFAENPQPHYVQVFATPKSHNVNAVTAKFWTRRVQNGSIFVLYTEVKRGFNPVLAAKVEVTVSRTENNGTTIKKERFELLDTGNGEPDIVKGDGVYTRYYNTAAGGPGTYTFEVTVTDNGNAYAKTEAISKPNDKPCCGSSIPTSAVSPLASFQRFLPPVTVHVTAEDIANSIPQIGRIGDLRVHILNDELKARLIWTAPDMGGTNVARYEIKYANSVEDITDKYETAAVMWNSGSPFPLAAGSETTFTLDLSQDPSFLDQPLYFAIRSYALLTMNAPASPVSNWVRIFVPSPVIPSTVPPTFESPDLSSWPYENEQGLEPDVIPQIAKRFDFGVELLLPIIGGILLLAILLTVYCYFCVLRRHDNTEKKSPKHSTNKALSGITIVPQSPQNGNTLNHESPTRNYIAANDMNDHHTIGLPINYTMDEEPKKRYSIVQQQEAQLIEELKQQQIQHQQQQQREFMQTPNQMGNVSVISNNTLQRNGGRILSPYESWTASQLLYEHERRNSPMEDMMNQQTQLISQDQNDHMSINDHMSLNGEQDPNMAIMNGQKIQIGNDIYGQNIIAPPVPPLPTYSANGYPINYPIYGVHHNIHSAPNTLYQTHKQSSNLAPFNPSLQGSLNSVNNSEKKRRNVTMV